MVLSEGPTGRQLQAEGGSFNRASWRFLSILISCTWIIHETTNHLRVGTQYDTKRRYYGLQNGSDLLEMTSLVDKYLCVWYRIVSTFRTQSFPAAFLHFLTKLSISVCRYGAAPFAHQKVKWMIKSAFCLFGLLGISHLFLADKRALIWRSQDASVSASVVTGLVYRNHSFLLSCLTPSLLFRRWRPRGNPPIGGCLSSSSHISSLVQWMQMSRPVFVLPGAACNHSPKRPNSPPSVSVQLVFSTVWMSPDADPLLAVKRIQMFSIMSLCSNWIMPARCAKELKGCCVPGECLQRKWTENMHMNIKVKICFLRMHPIPYFCNIYLHSHFSLPVVCISMFVSAPNVSLNYLIICLQGLPGSRYTRTLVCNGLFGMVGAHSSGTEI